MSMLCFSVYMLYLVKYRFDLNEKFFFMKVIAMPMASKFLEIFQKKKLILNYCTLTKLPKFNFVL